MHPRARIALLVAATLLIAGAASPVPQPPRTKVAAPQHVRSVDQEEARYRLGDLAAPGGTPVFTGAAATAPATGGDVVIAPPPAEFDAPAAATAPPPATLRAARSSGPSSGVWAVIIGIDDYPGGRSDLRSAVADANDVDAALAAYGIPGDRRLVLRNTQASAAVIADSLRWLVTNAGREATAVFVYAGHVRKIGSGREAMVGADGALVTDARMAELLRPLAARQTWLAMASCFGGGFTEALAPGRILTGAAGANSLAYENTEYGNSYMVEYMVDRAMREARAPGSVEQSFGWAHRALQADHPNRLPVQYDQVDGELRLGIPPAPPPPPPTPRSPGGQPAPSNPPPPEPPDDGHDNCIITLGTIATCGDRDRRS